MQLTNKPFGLVCVIFNLVSLFYLYKVTVYAHVALNVYIKDLKPKCLDCHLNVVGRFEFSMILRAMPSVVFNHFHQGHPWR